MKGHISKRGKTSWRLKSDGDPDPRTGKRKIQYHTFRGTKREAETKLALLIAETARGEYVDTTKVSVAGFIERWKRDWATSHVSAKTFERYAELLRNHVSALIGDIRLQKLRAINLNELYGKLFERP